MIRFLLFLVWALAISIPGVALIKITTVCIVEFYCHVDYSWSYQDVRFILIRGSIMALAFCVYGMMRYR